MRSAKTLLSLAPVILIATGCVRAELETEAEPETYSEFDPFDQIAEENAALADSKRRTPSIVISTKFIEITSGTEELGFDWILEPGALSENTSFPEAPRKTVFH